MGALGELIVNLTRLLDRTTAAREHTEGARRRIDDAQTLFGQVTEGSHHADVQATARALATGLDAIDDVRQYLDLFQLNLREYLAHISGTSPTNERMESGGPAPTTVLSADDTRTTPSTKAEHATEVFTDRERQLGRDPAVGRERPNETETAVRIERERNVVLTRSPDPSGPDWIDANGATYDAVGPFSGEHFDRQWGTLRRRIRDHLDKAEFVPVDVSRFSGQQIDQVREFITPLGSRVFLVGE